MNTNLSHDEPLSGLKKIGFVVIAALMFSSVHAAEQTDSANDVTKPVVVNAFNYVEAKTAIQFDKYLALAKGEVNSFAHRRSLVGVEAKSSKRLNRDTLYSVAIVDISKGATLVLPDTGNRYMSAQVVNEHGFTNNVMHGAGKHSLSVDEFDTPFVWVLIRTLVSESIPGDMQAAHALQDKVGLISRSQRDYSHAPYDPASFERITKLLVELGAGITSNSGAAGKKGEVDPIMQLITTAYGFGTLPETESFLVNVHPNLPADQAYTLNVKDVPVDGFWSLAVYNADGYYEKNQYGRYGVNDRTAKRNDDGSVTIHFGGDATSHNHVPIVEGWNYVVRLYRPREEILDGTWTFPGVSKVSDI